MVYNSFGILQNGEESWYHKLEQVKKYIDENNKRPSNSDKDPIIKSTASWIGTQQQTYIKKEQIMTNEKIYNKWSEFINDYEEYFIKPKESDNISEEVDIESDSDTETSEK
jgi:hypothetical protein